MNWERHEALNYLKTQGLLCLQVHESAEGAGHLGRHIECIIISALMFNGVSICLFLSQPFLVADKTHGNNLYSTKSFC